MSFNSMPGNRPNNMGGQQPQQYNSVRGNVQQQQQQQQQQPPPHYQNQMHHQMQQQGQPIMQQGPPIMQQGPPLVGGGAAAPPYVPQTERERMVYDQLFDVADINRNGQVSGQEAVQFLMLSGVQPPILKVRACVPKNPVVVVPVSCSVCLTCGFIFFSLVQFFFTLKMFTLSTFFPVVPF